MNGCRRHVPGPKTVSYLIATFIAGAGTHVLPPLGAPDNE